MAPATPTGRSTTLSLSNDTDKSFLLLVYCWYIDVLDDDRHSNEYRCYAYSFLKMAFCTRVYRSEGCGQSAARKKPFVPREGCFAVVLGAIAMAEGGDEHNPFTDEGGDDLMNDWLVS